MNDIAPQTDTRAALVEAGRRLFAEHGFDGASIRDLTAAAGANLASVTYHFGGKEGLYAEVVRSTLAPLADAVVAAATGPGAPLDRAEAAVRAHFGYVTDHPELPRLLVRSLLDTGMPPEAAGELLRRMLGAMVALVREGQADGTIRDGHPAVMGAGVMSQSIHLSLLRDGLKRYAGLDLAAPDDRRAVVENIVRSVRGALAARRGEDP
jgi:AcrR family transcriptional regulator